MDKLINTITPEQLIEIQKKQITDLVHHLRDANKRVKGFGYYQLEEFAAENEMPPELKALIKTALDNPDKEFIVNFKPNIILP